MKELWNGIDGFMGKWWWVILIALAFVILLFVIVVKTKNARIRKLKKQLKVTRTELETARLRDGVIIGRTRAQTAAKTVAPKTAAPAEPPNEIAGRTVATVDETDSYGTIGETTAAKTAAKGGGTTEEYLSAYDVSGEKTDETGDLLLETVQMDEPFLPETDDAQAEDENVLPVVDYYAKPVTVAPSAGSVKFTVVYDRPKDSWVIKKDGVERVVRRVDTKEEAMQIARELCRKYNANLVVHKKDGKFQKH